MAKNKEDIPRQVKDALSRLGQKIKLSRLRRGLSQKELADNCQLNRDTIYRLENDPASVSLQNLTMALFMLDRLDEFDELLDPGKDKYALTIESEELLSRNRVSRKKAHSKKVSPEEDFDWEYAISLTQSPPFQD